MNNNTITLEQVRKVIAGKHNPITWLVKKGFSESVSNEIKERAKAGKNGKYSPTAKGDVKVAATPVTNDFVEKTKGVYYNKTQDTYVFHIKSSAGPLTMPGVTHRNIIKNYSTFINKGLSIDQICRKFGMPRAQFNEYRALTGLTKTSLPASREEIEELPTEVIANSIIEQKSLEISQRVQSAEWTMTQQDAYMWRALMDGRVKPFQDFMGTFEPKTTTHIRRSAVEEAPAVDLIAPISDWHFGAGTRGRSVLSGHDHNPSVSVATLEKYARAIVTRGAQCKASKLFIPVLGDILHGLRSHTVKGTPLKCDVTGFDQYALAINALIDFAATTLANFDYVEFGTVVGNHEGEDVLILMDVLSKFFKDEPRAKFTLHRTRWGHMVIRNTLLVFEHGASAEYKQQTSGNLHKRAQEVTGVLMQRPELLVDKKERLYLHGDKHHLQVQQGVGFTFIQVGSPVLSDSFAENLGLFTRPSQQIITVNDEGLDDVKTVYFD